MQNNLKDFYVQFSLDKEALQKYYLRGLTYFSDFVPHKLDYSVYNKYRSDYFYVKTLLEYMQEQYANYVPVFLTLTLPGVLHNPASFNYGYNKLNLFFRDFQKNFLTKHKIQYKYFKIVEPHKDFTPHLHIILFVKLPDKTVRVNNNNKYKYIKFSLSYFKDSFNFYRKKHCLGTQYKFIVLNRSDTDNVVKYVSKYLQKIFNSDLTFLYALDGWKRYNRIRLFTYSRVGIPKFIFKKLLFCLSDNDKKVAYSVGLMRYLLDNVKIEYYHESDLPFSSPRRVLGCGERFYIRVVFNYRVSDVGIRPFFLNGDLYKHVYKVEKSEKIKKIFTDMNKTPEDYMYQIFDSDFFDFDLFISDFTEFYEVINKTYFIKSIFIFDSVNLEIFFDSESNFLVRDLTE